LTSPQLLFFDGRKATDLRVIQAKMCPDHLPNRDNP